ncbi:S9 family peptidase [Paracidobacterium acidisoli]|uniref:S9 family peptidase n=1 Tax=Paracidobacterium acidisoli TaxID=2303751 RepID=A0A372IIV2_9BACT|nr:S9 family peptidase [Paracidobacterium acidisoli]MBT9333310.1 S9 family peptidase [Paracidobacterium acidisoli]
MKTLRSRCFHRLAGLFVSGLALTLFGSPFTFAAAGAAAAAGSGPEATPKAAVEKTVQVHDPRIGTLIQALGEARAVRETAISPDGQQIVWTVSGRQGGEEIELAPVANPSESRRITACGEAVGSEHDAAWSPDSQHIAFFSTCEAGQGMAIYVAEASGGAAPRLLAKLNGYAKSLEWSPDGKLLSLLYVEGATRPSGALAAMKPPSGVIGVEGLEVQRIAVVDAASGELRQVSPAGLHVYEFDWSPDARRLAYVAAPPPGENNWWVAKLYTQDVDGQPAAILDPPTVEGSLHGLQIAVPRWSPDGKQIAFIGGLMSDQGSTGGDIYVIPAAGGAPRDITPETKVTNAWIRWISDSELGASQVVSGAMVYRTVRADGSQGDTLSPALLRVPASAGDGRLELSLSFASNGYVAFTSSSFASAPEVYVAKPGEEPRAVTHYNDGLKPSWGRAESMEWTNEGFHVQGWLLLPANYDPAKTYPMIVMVHGGPSSAVLPRWPGAGYGGVPFSALGYFVLMPNPRGSYGEGEKFTQANRKDFGYGDLRDILAGVDAVEKRYPVDDKRIGLTGWSYGGFMTMFAVTQTRRFHAAVAGAGISNWQSYYGENSIDQWMIPFFGASVYDDPAVYAKSSAIDFIKNVKTPTLEVVGDRDGECPAPQSFEFWHALHDLGDTTELVVYPNEGHGFVNPDHRRDVLERALAWFEEYMP